MFLNLRKPFLWVVLLCCVGTVPHSRSASIWDSFASEDKKHVALGGAVFAAIACIFGYERYTAWKNNAWARNRAISSDVKAQIKTKLSSFSSFINPGAKPEYHKFLARYPFGVEKKPLNVDLAGARRHLDSTHFGISYVKESIIDYLAGLWSSGGKSPKVLCFEGVPGVGKTTLAKSIAHVLGRDFAVINLSGVKDADLLFCKGYSFDPKGPGLLAQALMEAGSTNPVILLDELEKTPVDVLNAFLAVFDPSQNNKLREKYFNFDMDLSKITFIATVNSLAPLPEALRNRMQIIHLHPYSLAERIYIARDMLLKQVASEMNLNEEVTQKLDEIIEPLAVKIMRMEGGMRAFKRCLTIAAEKYARQIIERTQVGGVVTPLRLVSCNDVLASINPELLSDSPEDTVSDVPLVGVTNGLQTNGHDGGGLLKVQVMVIPFGKGNVKLGTQMGLSYVEAQDTAFSYAKSNAIKLKVDPKLFKECDFIFANQGGCSVDGPSAGLAASVALISALTGRAVRQDFAMTGAIDIFGNVLPVGGYRDKILGSEQPGIKNIVVPLAAKKTLEVIKESFPQLKIHYVSNVSEALEFLLI